MSGRAKSRNKHQQIDTLLSSEKLGIKKQWRGKIPVCIVFPNSYYIGMSNLAVHTLYRELNQMDDVVCERFFLGNSISLESKKPLSSFEILFFTLSFELDYVNVPAILNTSSISPYAGDRAEVQGPIIVAGGICAMSNPEPVQAFFDLLVLGDIESTLEAFMNTYRFGRYKKKSVVLEELSEHKWVYNPKKMNVLYAPDGTIESFSPPGFSVQTNCCENTRLASSAIISEQTEFSNMFLVEGSRGCPSKCPFCLLGNMYGFVHDSIAAPAMDTKDIGIVGGGISYYPDIVNVVKMLKESGKNVHFPSMRIDKIPLELINLIKDDISTLTFGIEAATEKLRRSIGKPFSNRDILQKIDAVFDIKLFNLKLYFMIGLFGETETDIDEIVELSKEIRHIMMQRGARKGFVGSITVHVSPFVPKPFTPFQWLPMDEIDSLKSKISRLKSFFGKIDNTYFTHESVKFSFLQGVLARGDRHVSDTITRLATGNSLSRIMNESPVNLNFYVLRERTEHEIFPWDFILNRSRKEELYRRLQSTRFQFE